MFFYLRLFFCIVGSLASLAYAYYQVDEMLYKFIGILFSLCFLCFSIPITRYGIDILLKVLVVVLPTIAIPILLPSSINIQFLAIGLGLLFLGLVLQFLRDPYRKIPRDIGAIVSPADGKVLFVKSVPEDESPLKERSHFIAIFMSPFNAHVNRVPMSGRVEIVEYQAGRYLKAFEDKASKENEQTKIILQDDNGYKVVFKQISGYVARRIVCKLKIGKRVERGSKFGMIKFGSRSDIFIPYGANILVRQGDRVKAGSTIIAKI